MNVYECNTPHELLAGNPYPGRGIVIGRTPTGRCAVGYFIMGRSRNSRNRVFELQGDTLYTRPFDVSLVEDPSLIIYAAVRRHENNLIVTNGDQTDTVYEGLMAGKSFSQALSSRRFEPDKPNLTPRISGMVTFSDDHFSYEMSILKSADSAGTACSRFTFSYPALPGIGHLIHTYMGDGEVLPTFCGEPRRVRIVDGLDEFTNSIWENLDADNRISLYTLMLDPVSGENEYRLINKNGGAD